MTEIWKPVVGFPNYMVSNLGRIEGPRGLLKQQRLDYWRVKLSSPNGIFNKMVHVLVCEAFHGPKPFEDAQALHRDDDEDNNREDNLYWGTHQQNMQDRAKNGKAARGERQGASKLTEGQIVEVFELRKGGMSQPKIANRFGVSQTCIFNILKRNNWRHIDV